MNREQIENLYFINGIGDFELKNAGDLMKVHGINARTIEGYSELIEEDKNTFINFIINYMNCLGLNLRICTYPIKVYKCDEYLRVDLIQDNKSIWLHIINNGKEWY